MTVGPQFPFSAVVGQDDAKLALTAAAADPLIGGVLLRGDKGTAKTTLARGLAALLPGTAPFVELPLGATEDRVVGSIDLAAALTGEGVRFAPGVLAAAHGGVLYVDEVNLLADHLVDVLLDVAASGVNRVEREGVSHIHPSRFVLVGSMNPEEGELRPQLLDRFGLCVDVRAPDDPEDRAEAVGRRLRFDADPGAFGAEWAAAEAALASRLGQWRPATVAPALTARVSALCASVGAESLRADLVVCRAAAAAAGFDGRGEADIDDVRRVAPLALAHRRRRDPFGETGLPDGLVDEALGEGEHNRGQRDDSGAGGRGRGAGGERVVAPGAPTVAPPLTDQQHSTSAPSGRRSTVRDSGGPGRLVGDRAPSGSVRSVAAAATLRAAAARTAGEGGALSVTAPDVREAVRERKVGNLVVLAVDASGSMGAEQRMEAAKGAVIGLLLDAYQRRDKVALVTFRDDGATVVLRPTGSVEVARARLAQLPTGGRTPLAAGIRAAVDLATAHGSAPGAHTPVLVVVSDGRATVGDGGDEPLPAARKAAAAVRSRGIAAVVVDAETGPTRLGLAAELAGAMGAPCLSLGDLSAGRLNAAVAGAAGPSTTIL